MSDFRTFIHNAIDNMTDSICYEVDNQLCDLYNDIIDAFRNKSIMNVNDFKFELKKENLLTNELEIFINNYVKNQ